VWHQIFPLHRTLARVQRCVLDQYGRLYLETGIGFGLVHTQDMMHAAEAVESGLWVPEDVNSADLPKRFGYVRSPAQQHALGAEDC
jgi:hypothetical protein